MRVIGELIVILGLFTFACIVFLNVVVSPALRKRHIADLEEENERLDRLIEGSVTPIDRKRSTQ